MAPKGRIAGLEGCYAVGWAQSGDAAACSVQVEDVDGRIVAIGQASAVPERESGLGHCAFRILLGELREAKTLRALVDGIELPGSPFRVGPGSYDGRLSASNGVIAGWITERLAQFEPPIVCVVDQDGEIVCEAQSQFTDEDKDPLFRRARFQAPIGNVCFGRNEVHLRALVNGTQFAWARCSCLLCGALEIVASRRCAGWLMSPDAPERKFEIELYRNGELIGRAKADRPRTDLQTEFPESWRCGFDIVLPAAENSQATLYSLSLRLRGSNSELFEGPYIIGDVPASIDAARKAAALTHGASSNLSAADRSLVQAVLADYIRRRRSGPNEPLVRSATRVAPEPETWPRLNIVIPIYRNAEVTRACIESVLAHRCATTDRLVLVNDCSPDTDMTDVLHRYHHTPNVMLLTNDSNLGFVKSVNRAFDFCRRGAVVLLNSDTRVFAGAFDELCNVANSSLAIGTVTAMSNKATIFSYPHWSIQNSALSDVTWERLAAIAIAENAGSAIDVPTAHGFCMLIKQDVLQRVGFFDEAFGLGYGEENDFCSRAADIGFRNVAAGGVFVEHRESVSFGAEKFALRERNLHRIAQMYPEYMPFIHDFARRDPIRSIRWPLDTARFRAAAENGRAFVVVIQRGTDEGVGKSADDATAAEIDASDKIMLVGRKDGYVEVVASEPVTRAVFAPHELEPLFSLLSAARPRLAIIRQVVGFPAAFIDRLASWVRDYRSISHADGF